MLVAVLDGVGLLMFLPLLSSAAGEEVMEGENANRALTTLTDGLAYLGIELTLLNILLVMLFFFSMKGVAKYCADYYRVILQQRFTNMVRLENMNLLAGYDYDAFTRADSGRIQNTFSGEVNRITVAYRYYFQMIQAGVMLLVYVGLACLLNPSFAIMVAVGGVLSNVIFNRIYKITKKASKQLTKEMNAFQGFLIQSVASFKYLKATSLIYDYKRKVDASIVTIEEHQRRVGKMTSLGASLREPLVVLIVVIVILIQVEGFGVSLLGIIASLFMLYRGLNSLNQVQNHYNGFLSVSGSMYNMTDFIKGLRTNQEPRGGQTLAAEQARIEINRLHFSYDERPLLNGLDLEVRPRQTIGLVGGSGTGKTTFVNILCGLLRVPRGMVKINGIDLTDLDLRAYRRRIGYVTQEAHVFSDTVRNNVSFWGDEANDERVWEALRNAHAEEFVRDLPRGLDTMIGINGINLSGGQRQRISIARELYRPIDLLIMDEATSALDSQSEHMIQENIDELAGEYTMIVIAHRLSTIKKADKIIYLKPNGKYEMGTFEDLRGRSASFQEMVALQSIG